MTIMQMKSIVYVVDNNFNITKAAQMLYISQPALSKIIIGLERKINIQIFTRIKGRLVNLTTTGQIIYEKSKEIIQHYDDLIEDCNFSSKSSSKKLLLGIPPVVITTLFPAFLNQLQIELPDIQIDIVELGATKLEKMLEELELDFAILLKPTGISLKNYNQCLLHKGDIRMYMSNKHPLARKKVLSWGELNNCVFALCNDNFRIHHLFLEKIKSENIAMSSLLTSGSSDYLFASIQNSLMIAPLPHTSKYIFNMNGIVEVPIENPIPWHVLLVYRKKNAYTPIEKYTIDFFAKYFKSRLYLKT